MPGERGGFDDAGQRRRKPAAASCARAGGAHRAFPSALEAEWRALDQVALKLHWEETGGTAVPAGTISNTVIASVASKAIVAGPP